MLGNKPNQHSKFRTKSWIEIDDDSSGTYITNIRIKFKTSMVKSSLCDYSDENILVNRTMAITGRGGDQAARQADEKSKGMIF